MIKINVVTNNVSWFRYIKSPNIYINRKIKKLNIKNKNFKKNIIFCTLLLSNNKEIKNLNKKFRKKNKTTDVLSFPFHNEKNLKEYMQWDSILIEINLKLGSDAFECYSCDFTHDYIDINADYRN